MARRRGIDSYRIDMSPKSSPSSTETSMKYSQQMVSIYTELSIPGTLGFKIPKELCVPLALHMAKKYCNLPDAYSMSTSAVPNATSHPSIILNSFSSPNLSCFARMASRRALTPSSARALFDLTADKPLALSLLLLAVEDDALAGDPRIGAKEPFIADFRGCLDWTVNALCIFGVEGDLSKDA